MRSSPLEKSFHLHYRVQDMKSGPWTKERLGRLCALLGLTQAELSQLIRIAPHQMRDYLHLNRIPRPVRLLLDLVERSAFATKLGQKFPDSLFPI